MPEQLQNSAALVCPFRSPSAVEPATYDRPRRAGRRNFGAMNRVCGPSAKTQLVVARGLNHRGENRPRTKFDISRAPTPIWSGAPNRQRQNSLRGSSATLVMGAWSLLTDAASPQSLVVYKPRNPKLLVFCCSLLPGEMNTDTVLMRTVFGRRESRTTGEPRTRHFGESPCFQLPAPSFRRHLVSEPIL